MNISIYLMFNFLTLATVTSAYVFQPTTDILRNQIVDCPPRDIRLAAELPIWLAKRQKDADVESVLVHLSHLEQSDCQPLAIMASHHMIRTISKLVDSSQDLWTHIFHATVLSTEQIQFSHNLRAMRPQPIYLIKRRGPFAITEDSVFENIMKAIVSTMSPGMIAELLQYSTPDASKMYEQALLIAEIAGMTKTDILLQDLTSLSVSPLSLERILHDCFAGREGLDVASIYDLMLYDKEFIALLGLGMLDEAKQRLGATLERNGLHAPLIVDAFHPELIDLFRIPISRRVDRTPHTESLLTRAETATRRCISSLQTPRTDDRDYLNLFLHYYSQATQDASMSDETEQFLLAQPTLAKTAMRICYPGVEEPETIRNFRTIWPLLTGKKRHIGLPRDSLRHPYVFDKVLGGSDFVNGLLGSVGNAIVERNRNRCLGDLLPYSVLMQYDELFLEVNPYSSAWHLTTIYHGKNRSNNPNIQRVYSYRTDAPDGPTHHLFDKLNNCHLLVQDHHQILLAPAARKAFFRPHLHNGYTFLFDDSSLIPRAFYQDSSAESCELGVNLATGDEIYWSPPSDFWVRHEPATAVGHFLNAQTDETIPKPDWFMSGPMSSI